MRRMNLVHLASLAVAALSAACGNNGNPVDGGGLPDAALADLVTLPDMGLPANLQVPAGNNLLLKANADGTQNYLCNATATDGGMAYAWALVGPDAKLSDDSGTVIGKHFAGPTWQLTDGSQVLGMSPMKYAPDPSAIPWLLLQAKPGTGTMQFAKVSYIQRLYTVGGKTMGTCDANTVGTGEMAHYTAVYYFWATP